VQKRVRKLKGPVLCLVGPRVSARLPWAKSLRPAQPIANSCRYGRFGGGCVIEAEIRGPPGVLIIVAFPCQAQLIQKMSKAVVRNPLFLFGLKSNKRARNMRGDPFVAAALRCWTRKNRITTSTTITWKSISTLSDVDVICTRTSIEYPCATC